jgi:hypothetical protein
MLQCECYCNIACACTNTSPARTFVVNSHKSKRPCTRSVYLEGLGFILADAWPLQDNRNSSAEHPVLILEMPFHVIMIGVLCGVIAPRSAGPFFFVIGLHIHTSLLHVFWHHVLTTYLTMREPMLFSARKCNCSYSKQCCELFREYLVASTFFAGSELLQFLL